MNNSHEDEKENEEEGLIDPLGITERIADKHIAIEKEVKKGDARKNIHIYIREFLIILVKIAQKHAKENPESELAGLGLLLLPISKLIIDAIVKEIKADPDDLNKLIEYFFNKLQMEGFFDVEDDDKEETKEAE